MWALLFLLLAVGSVAEVRYIEHDMGGLLVPNGKSTYQLLSLSGIKDVQNLNFWFEMSCYSSYASLTLEVSCGSTKKQYMADYQERKYNSIDIWDRCSSVGVYLENRNAICDVTLDKFRVSYYYYYPIPPPATPPPRTPTPRTTTPAPRTTTPTPPTITPTPRTTTPAPPKTTPTPPTTAPTSRSTEPPRNPLPPSPATSNPPQPQASSPSDSSSTMAIVGVVVGGVVLLLGGIGVAALVLMRQRPPPQNSRGELEQELNTKLAH